MQAAIGSHIAAREENIRAIQDVLASAMAVTSPVSASCWEKQKEGKKRMKTIRAGIDVPQEAFVAALSTDAAADKPGRNRLGRCGGQR